jgi:cytochrome P450 family 110
MPVARLRASWRWLAAPYAALDAERARRGPTFWVDLALVGRALVTGDPVLVREIAARHDLDAGRGISALRGALGDRSLITLDGADHLARRRLVAPLFHRDLEALDGLTVDATVEALRDIRAGGTFTAYDFARRISLVAIVRFLLPGSRAEEARTGQLVENFLRSFSRPWILFLRPLQLDLGPLSPWGRSIRNRERLLNHLRDRIRAARLDPRVGGAVARMARDAADLPEDEIACEALALLLFGHDTAAAALAWAFVHIWKRGEVVARIREEHDPLYLEACLKESLRLSPVVVHMTRIAPHATRIGGWDVPAGARIFPCAYLAQRDPGIFPEPDAFRPERFLNGQTYEGAWFPFGLGGRTCIGNRFALRQMQLIAGTVARHADLSLAPGYEPAPVRRLVLIVPRQGAPMVLRRVNSATPQLPTPNERPTPQSPKCAR